MEDSRIVELYWERKRKGDFGNRVKVRNILPCHRL